MKKRMAVVFLYEAENIFKLNVLAGALETYDYFIDLPMFFIKTNGAYFLRKSKTQKHWKNLVLAQVMKSREYLTRRTFDAGGGVEGERRFYLRLAG